MVALVCWYWSCLPSSAGPAPLANMWNAASKEPSNANVFDTLALLDVLCVVVVVVVVSGGGT